ncbi:MAG: anthranilate synthase component I family protein [Thermodesulfobacteriota bacterium]
MKLRCFPEKKEFVELCAKGNLVPVCMEILADTETPVTLLLKLNHGTKPLFLLESVEGGERWGRYSFLSGGGKCEIMVFRDRVCVVEDGKELSYAHHGDPFSLLRDLMARYKPVTLPGLPRFWGGLVGYLCYEMVSFIERIENKLPEQKPLAHFMVTDELYIFDNVRHTLTLVAHAFLSPGEDPEAAYDKAVSRIARMRAALNHQVPELSASGPPAPGLSCEHTDGRYMEKVRKVKDYIMAGDIIQSVISQKFKCSPAPDPAALYRAQRFVNPSPYMFFFHLGGTFLVGSSPETMVRLENGVATLRPIAGTRPRGASQQRDRELADELLADPKERAEHLMLVDLGRNDLGRVAVTGTVQVTDLMFVERYSHVMHLVSNITADLESGRDCWDLFAATFPAGTLSGAPKVRAMEIIAEMEESPRGPYGGAVGYISFSGNMDLAITIRTAQIEDGGLTVRAGAGIVADSVPETEQAETENKARAIGRAIELAVRGD